MSDQPDEDLRSTDPDSDDHLDFEVGRAALDPMPPADESPDPPPRFSRGATWLAMGAVALALLLVYLAPGVKPSSEDASLATGDDDAATDAAFIGRAAPLHFTLKDMNGVDVKLDSFKGKVILLNFWATWCPPCELEIPWLVEIQRDHPDDLVVLGVSIDDTPEKLKPYAADKKMNYPVLVGREREDVQDAFGPMFGIPVSVFIDRDGRISRRHSGIATKAQFEKEIEALL
jgi:cytochrome c biogenesis protein CcmG/thiol:disulfide interchange protein DsbE